MKLCDAAVGKTMVVTNVHMCKKREGPPVLSWDISGYADTQAAQCANAGSVSVFCGR